MTTHLWASPPFTQTNNTGLSRRAQSLLDTPIRTYSGLWGPAAPLGPVAAALVPRFALLPAPTPRDVLSAFGSYADTNRTSAETPGLGAVEPPLHNLRGRIVS